MSNYKIRFIEQRETESKVPKYYLNKLFADCAPYEEKFGKDLCNFSSIEIDALLRGLDFRSVPSFMVTKTHLKQYVDWCIKNRADSCGKNRFDEISIDDAPRFVNKAYRMARVVSRDEVSHWCELMPNPGDAVILLGLFEGIRGKDFCELSEMKGSDVDFDAKLIKLAGRTKPFKSSSELLKYIEAALDTTEYIALTGENERRIVFAVSDKVIKDYPNIKSGEVTSFRLGRRIYTKLARVFDYLGVADWMTAKAIFDSGIIHMVKTESNSKGITCDEYLTKYRSEVCEKFNINLDVYMLRREYSEFLE